MLGIIRTQRGTGEKDAFAHWFNRGTMVRLTSSSLFDYTATSVNPIFGHADLQHNRDYRFTSFAQKINKEDVFIIPERFEKVAFKLATLYLRARMVLGR